MDVLICTRHGLGDAVQLTVLLRHLQELRPAWNVDVAALVGKHSAYRGLCREVFCCKGEAELNAVRDARRRRYHEVYDLPWHECYESWADSPSTKAELCLRRHFHLTPLERLCNYTIDVGPEAAAAAEAYLEHITAGRPRRPDGRFPVLVIHYQGNTSQHAKDLAHEEAAWIVDQFRRDFGLVPLLLDWERPPRSPLAGREGVAHPGVDHPLWQGTGTGDAERAAALVARAALMVGIDSGPLHVAAATDTPTLAVWKEHHPVHYLCPAPNVLNMVRPGHEGLIRGNARAGLEYFQRHYPHRVWSSFLADLYRLGAELLAGDAAGLVEWQGSWVRADNLDQDATIVKDVLLEDCYRLKDTPVRREVVVDVGACLGSFALAAWRRNPAAHIVCVECCPENLAVLRRNVAGKAEVVQAALTYERDVALLNAVYPHCASTGGSTLASRAEVEAYRAGGPEKSPGVVIGGQKREYWADTRPLVTLTLEQLAQAQGFDEIDLLKLDCEGSEFSILANTTMLPRVRVIVGEYHGRTRFDALVRERFGGWRLEILREGDIGLFRLTNPGHARDDTHGGDTDDDDGH